MRCERIPLSTGDAYLETFFLDPSPVLKYSLKRPLILICPGGGYELTSDREGEPLAVAFAAQGFHTAVLRYPVYPALFPAALCALGAAMLWLREHAEENHIDPQQIFVSGYSAGGHLAASLGVFWHESFLAERLGCDSEQLRPNGQLLGYPVITSGQFAHRSSIDHLLGKDAGTELVDYVSLENRVSPLTPPTFLWHTYTDEIVPVENALLFTNALRRADVPFELHIYSMGEHGLSLASKVTENHLGQRVCPACAGWMDLACAWIRRQTGLE